ncbi:MAG: hypothetical protein IPH31_24255 [Lewinellaceae bacterium]|nr:hypothetical protein [Lewinellaceae bacterium]
MNYSSFANIFRRVPVFSIAEIEKYFPGFERENLLNWQKKGDLLRIRNGWYSISGTIKTLEHAYFVANKIYSPSYISLESALAHFGWIPEAVFTFTSVTTLKTNVFDTPKGRYRYATVKPSLFLATKFCRLMGMVSKWLSQKRHYWTFCIYIPKPGKRRILKPTASTLHKCGLI